MISTEICFRPDALTGTDIAEVIKNDLGFEGKYIEARPCLGLSRFKRKEHIAKIGRIVDSYPRVSVSDTSLKPLPQGQTFSSKRFDPHVDVLSWHTNSPRADRVIESIALRSPSFSTAYVHEWDDVYWQTEEQVDAYEEAGREYSPDEVVEHPLFGRAIDNSKKPGRQDVFPGMLIQPSWKMWFGPWAFNYLPKELLLSFRDAHLVEERKGLVFIQLFEHLEMYEEEESRRRQQSFRDFMNLDELLTQSGEIFDRDLAPLLDSEASPENRYFTIESTS